KIVLACKVDRTRPLPATRLPAPFLLHASPHGGHRSPRPSSLRPLSIHSTPLTRHGLLAPNPPAPPPPAQPRRPRPPRGRSRRLRQRPQRSRCPSRTQEPGLRPRAPAHRDRPRG